MKVILALFCTFISPLLLAQGLQPDQLWVGDAHNYLKIDTDAIRLEHFYEFKGKKYASKTAYRYTVAKDTLRLIEPRAAGTKYHDFLITSLSLDELNLVSLNLSPRLLAFAEIPVTRLNYKIQNRIFTDTVKFQKILFNSTTCYGFCPAMSLQIDRARQVKFIGDKYAVKQGFYSSSLSESLYGELIKLLAVSDLDKLENHSRFNIDLPTYTIEIHYNDKVKFIKSAIVPLVATPLLQYLLELPKRLDLKEAEQMEVTFSQQ